MEWALGWDVAGRLLVAAALGAVIGLEREVDDHPAGVRTFMTVSLGAALFGAVSTVGFSEYQAVRSSTNVGIDVERVASQVVVGIGFLGAGLIFRRGDSVVNLTTAAGLWATAAVGLAAGVGDVGLAVTSTAVLALVLVVVPLPKRWLLARFGRTRRRLKLTPATGATAAEVRAHVDAGSDLAVVAWSVGKAAGVPFVECVVEGRSAADVDGQISRLSESELIVDLHLDPH